MITRYVLINRQDRQLDYEYESYEEAVREAQLRNVQEQAENYAVIEREYEFSDSSLVWTPEDTETWPPK